MSDADKKRGARLQINFWRVRESDRAGSFDTSCEGAESWVFSDVGSHFGIQADENVDEARVREFGQKLAALTREYFAELPPVLDN